MTTRPAEEIQVDGQDPQSPVVGDQTPPPEPEAEPEPLDNTKEAEKVKEQGNVFFKAGKLQDAVEKYTRAIGAYTQAQAAVRTRVAHDTHPRLMTRPRTESQ